MEASLLNLLHRSRTRRLVCPLPTSPQIFRTETICIGPVSTKGKTSTNEYTGIDLIVLHCSLSSLEL